MKISYTICSANYLPYAKTLADSLIRYNPEYTFIIIVADREQDFDYEFFAPHTIITADELKIDFFEELNERYSIFELSCALKPFAAEYIYRSYPSCELLFYFDTDIMVFGELTEAEMFLDENSILITPHLATAYNFENRISLEKDMLKAGIYNAGFFGLRRHKECTLFLEWWSSRLKEHCFNKVADGLFVDQIWLNFAPIFFKGANVFSDHGYNVAYWNLGERNITEQGGHYLINDSYPLVFFHFSGFDFETDVLSKHFPFYTIENMPEVALLFNGFRDTVRENNIGDLLSLKPNLGKPEPEPEPEPEPVPEPPIREKFLKRKYNQLFGKRNV